MFGWSGRGKSTTPLKMINIEWRVCFGDDMGMGGAGVSTQTVFKRQQEDKPLEEFSVLLYWFLNFMKSRCYVLLFSCEICVNEKEGFNLKATKAESLQEKWRKQMWLIKNDQLYSNQSWRFLSSDARWAIIVNGTGFMHCSKHSTNTKHVRTCCFVEWN